MKKIIFLLLILLLTGCTNYTELNDLTIIDTLGIDYSNEYKVYMKSKDNKALYSSNTSLKESINNIYLTSNKQIYLSHINLLILTEDSINNKLDEILTIFLSDNNYRTNFYVIHMEKEDMEEFFNSDYTSEDIINLININAKHTSTTKSKDIEEFIKEILIDNNSYIPNIKIEKELLINGYTLIKRKKVYKTINIEDSILLNILTNHYNRLYIDNINIYEGNTNIKVDKNNITFTINILTDNKDTSKLEKKLYSFLDNYKGDYDLLKILNLIKKYNYNYYSNNKNIYQDINYKIIINSRLRENYIKETDYEKIIK